MKSSSNAAAASAINHLLRRASWTAPRLAAHIGKTAAFQVSPVTVALTVQDSGNVTAAAPDTIADATFTLSAALAARIVSGDAAAWDEVTATGDGEFARDLGFLAKNLHWDVEEDLSRVVGDIAAHRIVGFAGSLNRWRIQVTANVTASIAEYWTEERPLIATSARVGQFVREVDTLRDDVARFEKRMEQSLHARAPNHTAQLQKESAPPSSPI
ncbi:MAG: SCP2 sterol-binding domain-containing protein [Burkholderiales bacterium]|nr:SCP2 sterol-binding domain-containing protein [Burkholderiales bacterium]